MQMSKRKVCTENVARNDHAAADRHPPATKRKRVDIIKSTNRITFSDFIAQHVPKDNLQYIPRSTNSHDYTFDLEVKTVPYSTMPTTATHQIMTSQELDACFDLIYSTSHGAYSQSSIGWHPRRKKREMREAEMRYLIVRASRQDRTSAEAENIPGPHASVVSSNTNPAPKPAGNAPDAPTATDLRAFASSTAADPAPNSDKDTRTPRCSPAKLCSTTLSLSSTRAAGGVSRETELQRERLNALQQNFSPADESDGVSATQHDEMSRVAATGTLPAVTAEVNRCGKSEQADDVGSDSLDHVGTGPSSRHKNDEIHTTCKPRDDADTRASASTNMSHTASVVIGFASFMLTHAPPEPVIYLYELHLQPTYRALGLGAHLLRRVEDIGRSVGVQRAMLTVFKSNTDARAWYANKGWDVDSTSPADVELRRGSRQCDYEIRSKVL